MTEVTPASQTIQLIEHAFKKHPEDNFDPTRFMDECETILKESLNPGGEFYPLTNQKNASDASNAYGYAGKLFSSNGLWTAAETLLFGAWNMFGEIQFSSRQRVYRAGLAVYLAITYLQSGDRGAALRWAILTQADDLLGGHAGGTGKHLLRTALGVDQDALETLNQLTQQNLSGLQELNDDWSEPEAFAEDVFTRVALGKPEFAYVIGADSSVLEYPISSAYFRILLDKARQEKNLAIVKGKALEKLAAYLFLLIPGLVPRQNVVDREKGGESDVVVRNLNPKSNFLAEMLGRYFLVECKNRKKATDVRDVGYFLYRMHLTHAQFGIMFAKKGITGKRDDSAAYSLIRRAFHEDGSICITIDDKDLDDLAAQRSTFRSLILERVEQLRFGRPYGS